MLARAMQYVWWSGLSKDLERVRRECPRCTLEAPSQPKDMPEPIREPDYPFQMLVADYCQVKGGHFLVVVERYSN